MPLLLQASLRLLLACYLTAHACYVHGDIMQHRELHREEILMESFYKELNECVFLNRKKIKKLPICTKRCNYLFREHDCIYILLFFT